MASSIEQPLDCFVPQSSTSTGAASFIWSSQTSIDFNSLCSTTAIGLPEQPIAKVGNPSGWIEGNKGFPSTHPPYSSTTECVIPSSSSQEFLKHPLYDPLLPGYLIPGWDDPALLPEEYLHSTLYRRNPTLSKLLGRPPPPATVSDLPSLFQVSSASAQSSGVGFPAYNPENSPDLDKDWHAWAVASLLEEAEDSRGLPPALDYSQRASHSVEGFPTHHFFATATSNFDSADIESPFHSRKPNNWLYEMNDRFDYFSNSMLDECYPQPASSLRSGKPESPNGIYSSNWRRSFHQQPLFRKASDLDTHSHSNSNDNNNNNSHNRNNNRNSNNRYRSSTPLRSAAPIDFSSPPSHGEESPQCQLPPSDALSRRGLLGLLRTDCRGQPAKNGPIIRRTKPGEMTYISVPCTAILPSIRPSESLAPLHIVLPIALPYGKIIIGQNPVPLKGTSHREFPPHHYYFQKQFSSSNQLFSRLHGLSNQSPSWLALDVGYIACREHQVAYVVDLFNHFFCQEFTKLMKRRNRNKRIRDGPDSLFNESSYMEPIRLRCSGLRLREDHGTGWFLYETPVDACSELDANNFTDVIRLIENFNVHVRESKFCQNATLKPFTNSQFAIVVLKQEGSGLPDAKIKHASEFKCEGVEVSEIRLVRHKLQDKFGNAMFEKDPRFGSMEIYGRPIAHNKNGRHGRFVFAEALLPETIVRPAHQIHATISELEDNSALSEIDDSCDDCDTGAVME